MQSEVVRDQSWIGIEPSVRCCILVEFVECDDVFQDPCPRIVQRDVKVQAFRPKSEAGSPVWVEGCSNRHVDLPGQEEGSWIFERSLELGGTDEDFRGTTIQRVEDALNRLFDVCIPHLIRLVKFG